MTTTGELSEDLLQELTVDRAGERRILFVHATVHTMDPVLGDLTDADVLVAGTAIVRVGPGGDTVPEDDGVLVVDCTGSTLAPVAVSRRAPAAGLTPGEPATFAVVRSTGAGPVERLVWHTADAAAIVVDGVVQQWNGRRLTAPAEETGPGWVPADSPLLGTWVDGTVHQHLTADGRYDETRGGRRHAYQGAFWVHGDHVVYRDDLGFWAYGRLRDDVLHHAHFLFHRR
jgi:hypothetical protein